MARHKQAYRPIRRRQTPRFTIVIAYWRLEHDAVAQFAPRYRQPGQLEWAFQRARDVDRGHEHEYPEGNDPFLGDALLDLARENVRMWAEVWLSEHPAAA